MFYTCSHDNREVPQYAEGAQRLRSGWISCVIRALWPMVVVLALRMVVRSSGVLGQGIISTDFLRHYDPRGPGDSGACAGPAASYFFLARPGLFA
jgi:hypothetical protein